MFARLKFFQILWTPVVKFAQFIGKVNTVIFLSLFYYLILGPIAVISRLIKALQLRGVGKRHLGGGQKSYWIERDQAFDEPERLGKQF